ncbi:hypothetical protein [Gallaecimonas mangrovi]|uniref:hypothetical protein n=1 Tax=Gallaecimonas mangrovi TaxID=2291597 RepID=UPI000E207FFB|nr:hypothetical protein [Gallaecimonas mangrovi]
MISADNASLVTVFFIDQQSSWLLTGTDNDQRHAIALGVDNIRSDFDTPLAMERAIENIEDNIMPLAKVLPAESMLVITGPGADYLNKLTPNPHLTRDWVEMQFGEMAMAAERQHRLFDVPTSAALLMVREAMHHLDFDQAQLTPQ